MRKCTFPGCDRRHAAKDLCAGHYQQRRLGLPLTSIKVCGPPAEIRFWSHVDKRGNGCWIWKGTINGSGYGMFRRHPAHRYCWELLRGPIPDRHVIDHDHPEFGCHTPACVNPDHLQAVPQSINGQRRRGLQSNNTSGERGVSGPNHKGIWSGEVAYTDSSGKKVRLQKASKNRAAISSWVVEMRERYHN